MNIKNITKVLVFLLLVVLSGATWGITDDALTKIQKAEKYVNFLGDLKNKEVSNKNALESAINSSSKTVTLNVFGKTETKKYKPEQMQSELATSNSIISIIEAEIASMNGTIKDLRDKLGVSEEIGQFIKEAETRLKSIESIVSSPYKNPIGIKEYNSLDEAKTVFNGYVFACRGFLTKSLNDGIPSELVNKYTQQLEIAVKEFNSLFAAGIENNNENTQQGENNNQTGGDTEVIGIGGNEDIIVKEDTGTTGTGGDENVGGDTSSRPSPPINVNEDSMDDRYSLFFSLIQSTQQSILSEK